jgi:hypothetical protein
MQLARRISMDHTYRERPSQPNWKQDEIDWTAPEQWGGDDGGIHFCWPLKSEAQMWEQVMCHVCGRPARWVGLASPFGDGQQYFAEFDAWCYWCFPRNNLTREEQRLARHADWARQQTRRSLAWQMKSGMPSRPVVMRAWPHLEPDFRARKDPFCIRPSIGLRAID